MTNRIRRIGVCSVLLISVGLVAQTKGADLVADVPFAFIVAGRTLPAGRYVVNRLNDDISIRDGQNQNSSRTFWAIVGVFGQGKVRVDDHHEQG